MNAPLAEASTAPRFQRGMSHFLHLVKALTIREFKGQYRRSLLGPLWALLNPLATMVLFLFLRGVLNIQTGEVPYAIFCFSALVPWTFFSGAVTRSAPSIIGNAGILKKIALPREVFPVAALATALSDLLFALLILAGMMLWFHSPVGWPLLWLLPLTALTAVLALAFGFIITALGTYKRDILFVTPFALQLLLFASPVLYPMKQVPDKWLSLYQLNPLVGILEGFRTVIVYGQPPDSGLLVNSVGITLLLMLVAWPLFRHLSQYFSDAL